MYKFVLSTIPSSASIIKTVSVVLIILPGVNAPVYLAVELNLIPSMFPENSCVPIASYLAPILQGVVAPKFCEKVNVELNTPSKKSLPTPACLVKAT